MKSTFVYKIRFEVSKVDGSIKVVGLKYFFKDRQAPIQFGSEGNLNITALFDESEPIDEIHFTISKSEEKYLNIIFFQKHSLD